MKPETVVITMPCFNEAEGIAEFISDLLHAMRDFDTTVFVVNDASTDGTLGELQNLQEQFPALRFVSNLVNRGHGFSTLVALREALTPSPSVIVSVDGDGQFLASDIRQMVQNLVESECDLIEGIRIERADPTFRKVTSAVTRVLLSAQTRSLVRDANTPLRAYRPYALAFLLSGIPDNTLVPNLHISRLSRRSGMNICEMRVRSIPRRGSNPDGSTWNNRRRWVPGTRFVKFSLKAAAEMIWTPRTSEYSRN